MDLGITYNALCYWLGTDGIRKYPVLVTKQQIKKMNGSAEYYIRRDFLIFDNVLPGHVAPT